MEISNQIGFQEYNLPAPYGIKLTLRQDMPKPKSALHLLGYLATQDLKGARGLDIGTGPSGVLALGLKALGAKDVVGVDIDPEAIDSAKTCSDLSRTIDWRVSDLFSSIGHNESFDMIVSNPPQLPMSYEGKWHDYGGVTGREVLFKLFKHIPLHLNDGGKFVVGLMDYLGTDQSFGADKSLFEIAKRFELTGRVAQSKTVMVRKGGATEASLGYIRQIYPKYDFGKIAGGLSYQYQIVEFKKS